MLDQKQKDNKDNKTKTHTQTILSSFLAPKRKTSKNDNVSAETITQRNEITNAIDYANCHSKEEIDRTKDRFVIAYLFTLLFCSNVFLLYKREITCFSTQNSSYRKKKNQVKLVHKYANIGLKSKCIWETYLELLALYSVDCQKKGIFRVIGRGLACFHSLSAQKRNSNSNPNR